MTDHVCRTTWTIACRSRPAQAWPAIDHLQAAPKQIRTRAATGCGARVLSLGAGGTSLRALAGRPDDGPQTAPGLLSSPAVQHLTLLRAAFTGLCIVATGAAFAHDTWLHVADQQPGSGLLALQMGSGARYPKSEGAVPASRVLGAGCADDTGASRP